MEAHRKKTTSQAHPDSWAFPAPSGPLGGQARAWQGAESSLTRRSLCLILQSADSTPRTSAGWKVWRFLSPAHCLGLSMPTCEGSVLLGDTLGGVPGDSGAARWGVRGSSQHPPQASPGCSSCTINFRSHEASLRLLRAPQLTSTTGIFRVESLPLSAEGGHWQGEAALWRGPSVQMPLSGTQFPHCPGGMALEDVLGPPGPSGPGLEGIMGREPSWPVSWLRHPSHPWP